MTRRAAHPGQGLVMLRLRVSVDGSEPTIWRLFDLEPSLTLDKVHEVLQTALGWRNAYQHWFTHIDPSRAPRPVNGTHLMVRRWVPENVPVFFDHDVFEANETLGRALTPTSKPLFYVYDEGDTADDTGHDAEGDRWVYRIEVISSVPAPVDSPRAYLVDGARQAPLEESGGVSGYQNVLHALANPGHNEHGEAKAFLARTAGPWQAFDPERLDVDAVNNELEELFLTPPVTPPGHPPLFLPLTRGLTRRLPPGMRREFRSYLETADLEGPDRVDAELTQEMTGSYLWLLRRVGTHGITLTPEGRLPPDVVNEVVREAMTGLGRTGQPSGEPTSEDQTPPVLRLRESVQHLGLARTIRGQLVLTTTGKDLLEDPKALWYFLTRTLARRHQDDAHRDAAHLLLIELAVGRETGWTHYLDVVSFGLRVLGYTTHGSTELEPLTVQKLLTEPYKILLCLGVLTDTKPDNDNDTEPAARTIALEGQAFARATLHT